MSDPTFPRNDDPTSPIKPGDPAYPRVDDPTPFGTTPSSSPPLAEDDATESVKSSLRAGAAQLGEEASKTAEQLKQESKTIAADVTASARAAVEDQKTAAVEQGHGIATALRETAESLEKQDQSLFAGYARQAAAGIDSLADAIEQRQIDDLVSTIQDFARRQPALFIGGAVMTGLLIARFAKASAERSHPRQGEGGPSDTFRPAYARESL